MGTSLVVQRLWLCVSTAGSLGSIPGQELRSHMPRSTDKKKKESRDKPQKLKTNKQTAKLHATTLRFLFIF